MTAAEFAFDVDTTVDPDADGRYSTHLSGRWSIGTVPNGGYSLAPIVRALLHATDRPDPLSITTHYYRPTIEEADATITTEIHRAGRAFTNASAVLEQDGKERTRTTAVLGELPAPGVDGSHRSRPPIAEPDHCPARDSAGQGIVLPLMDMIDVRIDPTPVRHPEDPDALLRGWIRFRDERPPDPIALTLFVDAFPPSIMAAESKVGWVPTLELTLHVRRRPVPGWIAAEVRSEDIAGDRLIEDVRLWDASGALVAQGRQLAMRGQAQ